MPDDLTALVQRAQQGNDDALAELVQFYATPAKRVAQNILSNSDDAEDAVQDAWILAIRNFHTLREQQRFGAWFYRIVANLALRKRQKELAQPVSLDILEKLLHIPDEASSESSYHALLPMAMGMLSSKDHLVITLHYFGSVPVAQLAALLDVPLGTIKSRLHHARQFLRKELLQMSNHPITPSHNRPEHIPADFRQTIAGMKGIIEWRSIFTGDFTGWSVDQQPVSPATLPANWTVVGQGGLVGEQWHNGTQLTYGEADWHDVEFSLLVTPLAGGNAQLLFRIDEQRKGFYLCDMLMGWQAIAVSRVTFDEQEKSTLVKLSVVNYPLAHQREYAVTIAARDHSITTYIDGALVNQVTDSAWLHGQIGLNVWEAKTLFRDIRVRVLD